jgi:hypothetical protein
MAGLRGRHPEKVIVERRQCSAQGTSVHLRHVQCGGWQSGYHHQSLGYRVVIMYLFSWSDGDA